MPDLLTVQRGTTAGTAPAWTPVLVPYEYRKRDYPWAIRALTDAEAIHGTPPEMELTIAEQRAEMAGKTIPAGLCQCGCGQHTTVATKNDSRYGQVKGQPVRYVRGHNQSPDAATVAVAGKPRCESCGYLTARCSCEAVKSGA